MHKKNDFIFKKKKPATNDKRNVSLNYFVWPLAKTYINSATIEASDQLQKVNKSNMYFNYFYKI